MMSMKSQKGIAICYQLADNACDDKKENRVGDDFIEYGDNRYDLMNLQDLPEEISLKNAHTKYTPKGLAFHL